jgi:RNA polymerase sigma-70 factor (ECF subfamily)
LNDDVVSLLCDESSRPDVTGNLAVTLEPSVSSRYDMENMRSTEADEFEQLRPLLYSIAYRMIGSVAEAEDIVQEAFLRYHRARQQPTAEIEQPKAYLSAVTTRLAIDHLRSARVRRETYVGPWLPEPIVEDPDSDPSAHAELADSLSLAFMVVLERLNPVERAVFLLHEVFDFSYAEIAHIVERSEDNCRQLGTRARRHVEQERPRFRISRERQAELTVRFLNACIEGDTESLVGMLAADVEAWTDGGGRAQAARRVVEGADHVTRFLTGIVRNGVRRGMELDLRPAIVNAQAGVLLIEQTSGEVVSALALDVGPGEEIRRVCMVLNPDKLARVARPGRTPGPTPPPAPAA